MPFKRAKGRTLAEFINVNGILPPAEQKLLDASANGELARVGEKRPERPTDINIIRPGFLRFLALGGDENAPVHENGIQVQGAWITGDVDLQGCVIRSLLSVISCQIDGHVIVRDAELRSLNLQSSSVHSIEGDSLHCQSYVLLRYGFYARGIVRLISAKIGSVLDCSDAQLDGADVQGLPGRQALLCDGAKIGTTAIIKGNFCANGSIRLAYAEIAGNLECIGGRFENAQECALVCDGIKIGGSVFIGGNLHASNTISFRGAQILGNLACRNVHVEVPRNGSTETEVSKDVAFLCDGIEIRGQCFLTPEFHAVGEVRFPGARIGGELDCAGIRIDAENGIGFAISRARIGGALILQNVRGHPGRITFNSASVGTLIDDVASWRLASSLMLDGFRYDRIVSSHGEATVVDAASRIEWLRKQPKGDLETDFKAQPWEQLIKVLRDRGHYEEAKEIAIAKQAQLRRAGKIKGLAGVIHALYGALYGYGYRPMRLAFFATVIWFICSLIYCIGANQGVMVPTDRHLLDDPRYLSCRPDQFGNWTKCSALDYEYTKFNPFLFSLDLILPIIGLQQAKDWTPTVSQPCVEVGLANFCLKSPDASRVQGREIKPAYWPLGVLAAVITRLENLFGWIAGLMFVAVASGFIKKD